MHSPSQDHIRVKAFELSQLADRAHLSALDHWLEAERQLSKSLEEAPAAYEPAPATKPRRAQPRRQKADQSATSTTKATSGAAKTARRRTTKAS